MTTSPPNLTTGHKSLKYSEISQSMDKQEGNLNLLHLNSSSGAQIINHQEALHFGEEYLNIGKLGTSPENVIKTKPKMQKFRKVQIVLQKVQKVQKDLQKVQNVQNVQKVQKVQKVLQKLLGPANLQEKQYILLGQMVRGWDQFNSISIFLTIYPTNILSLQLSPLKVVTMDTFYSTVQQWDSETHR